MRNRPLIVVASVILSAAGFAFPASSDPLTGIPGPVVVDPDSASVKSAASSSAEDLVGLFEVRKGACGAGSGQGVTSGSYFKMFDPNGALITNNDSPCGDKNFTPLSPGTDAGLATAGYQPNPDPAFDKPVGGHGLNAKITQPQSFFGTRFSVATNATDPQTSAKVVAPKITHDGSGNLTGDLRSFAAAWQSIHFNQGSPKPDGSKPGGTSGPTGTFNFGTAAYTLEWKSLIKSNQGQSPFENFTGFWHLEGTFKSGLIAPGVQPAQVAGVRTKSGGTLSSTGPGFPVSAGWILLALGIGGLATDAMLGRRARRSKHITPAA